ncbi:MAG: transaldolase family protein [Chlamydiota bacterium]
MEIWLDTIDFRTVKDGVERGLVSGVTTNPSILAKAGNVQETLAQLLEIQPGPLAVQVTAQDPSEMIDEARAMIEFSNRIIVKIPVCKDGLIAMEELRKESIPVMGTAVLFPKQALLASALQVAYIAPYFSHMTQNGNPSESLKMIVETLRIQRSGSKVLAASVKELDHFLLCAQLGVDAVTIKQDLYEQLIADHATVEGFTQKFLSEWKGAQGALSIKQALRSRND